MDEMGNIESDFRIRENLSTLIGYEISYKDGKGNSATVVILFKNITKEVLEAHNCLEDVTIGKLREIAKTIHPDGKLIDEMIAAYMWLMCVEYYTIRFLLDKKGIKIPDIQILSSVEEYDSDDSTFINTNSSCGYWSYLDDDGGSGVICHNLPVWCYLVKSGRISCI